VELFEFSTVFFILIFVYIYVLNRLFEYLQFFLQEDIHNIFYTVTIIFLLCIKHIVVIETSIIKNIFFKTISVV